MRKFKVIFFAVILVCSAPSIFSQNLHLNVFGGIANYKGDLQYNPKGGKQISFKQPRLALGVGLEYELFSKFYLRLAATVAKIHADDKQQPGQQQRNLNFTTPIFDVALSGE